jgi:hypothetical protein
MADIKRDILLAITADAKQVAAALMLAGLGIAAIRGLGW